MLEELREANLARQAKWPGNDQADVAFRAIEVAGEAGELMEAVKKWLRAERGIKGSTATLRDIAGEMCDVLVALDLLANELGIDLAYELPFKFNATSRKYQLDVFMPEPNAEA